MNARASDARPGAFVGETIDERFDLLAFAAAGGMGHVYRARDRETGELVAVKLVAPEAADARRFAREAEVLASIDHPGVVRYLAHGTTKDGAQYLAMEWLTGHDLAQRLDEGTLGVADALSLARGVAGALAAAHRLHVVHRDLKPANLFLVDGRLDAIKLIDFGVARSRADEHVTLAGAVVGTPAYMAPEQVRGAAVDPRADVYGLGAVIFRCLVGHPPFCGTHSLAVLAKVLLETPSRIRELRPDVPAALEALLARTLAKEPEARPADGGALLDELRAVDQGNAGSERRIASAISARELRIACVVLCAATGEHEPTIDESTGEGAEDVVRRAVEERGGTIDALGKRAWVMTVPNAASPAEQAIRAVRCARALTALRPDAPLFVATGRVLVTGENRVGEVIDRAAAALVEAGRPGRTGGVHVDAATADLLGDRFRIAGDGEWRELVAEDDAVAPVRTFLGKPSPCVGREPSLALLGATIEGCLSEQRASAMLVSGAPGLGKTRLANEVLRTTLASHGDVEILFAAGDPIRTSSPLGIAGEILKRAMGVLDSDPAAVRASKLAAFVARDFQGDDVGRMQEMLGEICGVPAPRAEASASLLAARADVSIMADALREAWIEWLGARAARGVVLLLIEDLHWADASSIRLVEDALSALHERTILLLATSRSEGSACFSARFRARGIVEVVLGPLSARASERLVRDALGASVDDVSVHTLVARAGGHPFFIEELVRAVAEGRGAETLPDSVLGMVQARLDDLGAESRRLLRAASVFGQTFWPGAVAALLGDDVSAGEIGALLGRLVEQEVLSKESASTRLGESEYRFRHALLRDGAYAMLADADRAHAHRRAASWLEAAGERDPAVLADHYDQGGATAEALRFFHLAAAQALQRNDFDGATGHASRARALGADAATDAALRAIEGEVAYWRGDFAGAAELASQAAGHLARTAPEWFDAVAVAIGAHGQLGRNDAVTAWVRDAASASSPPESRAAHVVALCRGMTQLFWAHPEGGLTRERGALDALVGDRDASDSYLAGWVHRVRGESAWLHARDVGLCLRELDASCEAFDHARAARAACLARMNAASLTGWSGSGEGALELLARARAEAERLGAGFLLRYARAVEGLVRAYRGDPAAESMMRSALADLLGSPRLAFICRFFIGSLALDRGDVDAAAAEATALTALAVVDDLRCAGIALASRVALARGEVDAALSLGEHAARIESSRVDLELTHGTAAVALAEAHLARGERSAAYAALAPTASTFAAIAQTIARGEDRQRFWQRRFPCDRVAALARELAIPGVRLSG